MESPPTHCTKCRGTLISYILTLFVALLWIIICNVSSLVFFVAENVGISLHDNTLGKKTYLNAKPLFLVFNKPFVVATGSVLLRGAVAGTRALNRVVCHHSDDVQQTGKQLQGEVEHTDPKA